jgi:hypothetical protein
MMNWQSTEAQTALIGACVHVGRERRGGSMLLAVQLPTLDWRLAQQCACLSEAAAPKAQPRPLLATTRPPGMWGAPC